MDLLLEPQLTAFVIVVVGLLKIRADKSYGVSYNKLLLGGLLCAKVLNFHFKQY